MKNTVATLLIALAAGTALAQQAPTPAPAPAPTRAEVLADLAIYRESGLQELDSSPAPMSFTPEYQAAKQRYDALRRSPHYAELVRRYEAREPLHAATAKR